MTNGGQRHDPSGFRIENEMDLLFGRAHPNPTREGCPPADLLMRLAHRELPIGDPAYDHIGKCSPCYQELRTIQQADAARLAGAVRRKRLAYAAAAPPNPAGRTAPTAAKSFRSARFVAHVQP